MSHTYEYRYWCKIKARCYGESSISYPNYGGRGIQMHPAWKDDFMAFRAYIIALPDFGKDGYTLDRIDNDGNYEPGNVRWASRITQSNNTRANINIEFRGKSHTIAEWGRIVGIPGWNIASRLRNGWGVERALTSPLIRKPKRATRRVSNS